jgi:hypothetical protein
VYSLIMILYLKCVLNSYSVHVFYRGAGTGLTVRGSCDGNYWLGSTEVGTASQGSIQEPEAPLETSDNNCDPIGLI